MKGFLVLLLLFKGNSENLATGFCSLSFHLPGEVIYLPLLTVQGVYAFNGVSKICSLPIANSSFAELKNQYSTSGYSD